MWNAAISGFFGGAINGATNAYNRPSGSTSTQNITDAKVSQVASKCMDNSSDLAMGKVSVDVELNIEIHIENSGNGTGNVGSSDNGTSAPAPSAKDTA